MDRIETENLDCRHILDQPLARDWTVASTEMTTGGDPDDRSWSWAECVVCPTCKRNVVAVNGYVVAHESAGACTDEDGNDVEAEECLGEGDHVQEAEGPQMNYWYLRNTDTDKETDHV